MLIIKTPTYKEMAYISKDKLRNKPPENIMVSGNRRPVFINNTLQPRTCTVLKD